MIKEMGRHCVFIINPHSGTDRNKALETSIGFAFKDSKITVEIQRTRFAHHGIALAQDAAAAGAWAVVAVGGDGSVNDVAQGIIGTHTQLGIIPKGSGNGLARSLGIPLDVQQALEIVKVGRSANIDVGYANGRLFLSNAGVGFDALISKSFARSTQRGLATYSKLVFGKLWQFKSPSWELDVDGKVFVQKAFLINAANGQQFGYNLKIASTASLTDGRFDVVIVKPFPKLIAAKLVWRAWKGSLTNSPYVQHIQARNLTIRHRNLRLYQTDGDAHNCDGKVNFVMKEGALGVLVPH